MQYLWRITYAPPFIADVSSYILYKNTIHICLYMEIHVFTKPGTQKIHTYISIHSLTNIIYDDTNIFKQKLIIILVKKMLIIR